MSAVKQTAGKRRVGDGTPGPGRKKGIPNKTTTQAREAFQMAFDKIGGPEYLATWAKQQPTEFFKLFARLIPIDVNAKADINGHFEVTWKSAE